MAELEENIRTCVLNQFNEVDEMHSLIDQAIPNCDEFIMMEADLEKMTGSYNFVTR